MSDEIIATPVIEDVSINKLFNMTCHLVKRNLLITFLLLCLIGVIIYYFVNVRPFKGSSFTHDHENYHYTQPQNSKQQIEKELTELHIMQQQAQLQQQAQMQQQAQLQQQAQMQQQAQLQQAQMKQAQMKQAQMKQQPQLQQFNEEQNRQLPNDLIKHPLEQVKQPVKVLTDTSEDDLYDVVNDEGMELNVKARPQ